MQIRTATDNDWDDIFPFYQRIMDEGRTYAWPSGETWEAGRAFWTSPPNHVVVAVDDDGAVVGTAKMGPNRPARGSHVATASFLVDPDASGRGIGRALGRHMLDWARAEGYHSVQFNAVVETNEPAVHLWHSLGFTIIGTVPHAFDHPDHGLVGLHIMYQPLG